jgi:hypothetical protein
MLSRLKNKLTSQSPLCFDDLENIISVDDDDFEYQKENLKVNKFCNQNKELFTKRNPISDRTLDIGKFEIFSSFANGIIQQKKEQKNNEFKDNFNTENIHPNKSKLVERKTNSNKLFAATVEDHHRENAQPNVGDRRFSSSRQLNDESPTTKRAHIERKLSDTVNTTKNSNVDEQCDSAEQDDLELLLSKIRHNRIDYIVEAMQKDGFNAQCVDTNGNTMMHVCAQNNNRKIAAMLLDCASSSPSSINAVNLKGFSPLDYAEKYGFEKLASFLISKGARNGSQLQIQKHLTTNISQLR